MQPILKTVPSLLEFVRTKGKRRSSNDRSVVNNPCCILASISGGILAFRRITLNADACRRPFKSMQGNGVEIIGCGADNRTC